MNATIPIEGGAVATEQQIIARLPVFAATRVLDDDEIERLDERLVPCPFCRHREAKMQPVKHEWQAQCACGGRGPKSESIHRAAADWNAWMEGPPPQPVAMPEPVRRAA